jgi:hypothetical protein
MSDPGKDRLLEFSLRQWRETPVMGLEDAYKWLFQAVLGGEHAVGSAEGVRRWMEEEWAGLEGSLTGESLAQDLRPDGSLLRLNLRPFRALGGSPDTVLAAFLRSAAGFQGRRKDFVQVWEGLRRSLETHHLSGLTTEGWDQLDRHVRQAGFPALHHSPAYEAAYRPAYRIVLREAWLALAPDMPLPRSG